MFSIDGLRVLYRHMEWADAEVWRAALALEPSADARLGDLLLHIHTVQRAFLSVWTEQSPTFPDRDACPTLADVQAFGRPYYADVRRFLDACDPSRLQRPLVMPWVAEYERHLGRRFDTTTLAETMFQVTSHSTYHRGQVNTRIRELGGEPPPVDFIAWIWFGKPAPDWSRPTVAS